MAENTEALRVSAVNGVKVYNCTAGKTTPQWLEDYNKGKVSSLRYNQEYRNRIELIEGFDFPAACTSIRLTNDGGFIGAAGVYKPQVKVFDTSQLSMKFERHLDAEIVQFDFLSDDYSKIAFLRNDRTVEIHASYGRHYQTRIPHFGRDLAYHYNSCDLYMASSSQFVYRLNLFQGTFRAPLTTELKGVNKVRINAVHQLVSLAGEDGVVECWDPRDNTRVKSLGIASTLKSAERRLAAKLLRQGAEVSALEYGSNGLSMACGMSTGHVLLYDLRKWEPLLTKDHRNGLAIKNIVFHEQTRKVLSMDKKAMKIWDVNNGDPYTSIEGNADFNDVVVVPNSGLIMAAAEQHRIMTYYVPSLGPAPRWLAYLDTLTEELEEAGTQSSYDDYKFVTRDQLEEWGITNMIGTNLLKAYMHGFYMDARLYDRVKPRAVVNEFDEYMNNKVQDKIRKKQEERITVKKRLPKVNRRMAESLLAREDKLSIETHENEIKNPLQDDRFSAMFADTDYEIDPESNDFLRLNPHGMAKPRTASSVLGDDGSENEDTNDDDDMEDNTAGLFDAVESSDSEADMVYNKKNKKKQQRHSTKKAERKDDTARHPAMYAMKEGLNVSHVLGNVIGQKRKGGAGSSSAKTISLEDRLAQKKQRIQTDRIHGQSSYVSSKGGKREKYEFSNAESKFAFSSRGGKRGGALGGGRGRGRARGRGGSRGGRR